MLWLQWMPLLAQGIKADAVIRIANPGHVKVEGNLTLSAPMELEGRLTVNGNIVHSLGTEGLRMKAGPSATASLLHQNSGVEATLVREFTGEPGFQWFILSSPVADQVIQPEFHRSSEGFIAWDEIFQNWISIGNDIFPDFAFTNNGSYNFLIAKGYQVYYNLPETGMVERTFSGTFNQGKHSFELSRGSHPEDRYTGYNLMGNPFPSPIDWEAELGWEGKEYLHGEEDKSMWVWNAEYQNFGVVHPASHAGEHNKAGSLIAPTQGFWVKAGEGHHGQELSMDNRVRVHGAVEYMKRRPVETDRVVRLVVEAVDNGFRDEVILEFGHENRGGAEKMFSPSPLAPEIYLQTENGPYSLYFSEHSEPMGCYQLVVELKYPGAHILKAEGGMQFLLTHLETGDQMPLSQKVPVVLGEGPATIGFQVNVLPMDGLLKE